MLISSVYSSKANYLELRESNIPPSQPTLYLLDEAKYVPNDTLKQLVELVMINDVMYGPYFFEPNDSLITNTLEKIQTKALNENITHFAQVLKAKMNQLKEGEKLPDFQFNLFEQDSKNLSDYSGQFVLLDFWFSGCKPCIKAVPRLNNLDKETENLIIIGINPVDNQERFLNAIDKFKIKYNQMLIKGSSELPTYFNVGGYPTYILIDPEGKYLTSFANFDLDEIQSYLK